MIKEIIKRKNRVDEEAIKFYNKKREENWKKIMLSTNKLVNYLILNKTISNFR